MLRFIVYAAESEKNPKHSGIITFLLFNIITYFYNVDNVECQPKKET